MATSATDALYQQYIASGMSPENARMAANFDLSKYQSGYQAQQQFIANAPKYTVPGAYDYTTQYGGMDIVPGMTSGVLANLGIQNPIVPVYQLLGSENKGEPNNAEERMQFMATPGATYRLKNNKTGEIIGTAATAEELSALVQQSNAMSQQLGTGANLTVQRSNPQSIGGGYTDMFTDSPDKVMNTITNLALAGMIVATGAGLLQPGGLGGLGATGAGAGSGAGIGATGSLAGAGLSSLPVNLAAIQAGANAALAGAGLGGAALGGAVAGGILGGVEALPGIVVTGAGGGSILPVIGGLGALGGGAAALAGGAGGSGAAPSSTASNPTTNPAEDILVTAGNSPTNLLPSGLLAGAGVGAGIAAAAGGGAPGSSGTSSQADRTDLSNAQNASINGLPSGAGGVFGTGLSLRELYDIGSIGAAVIGGLAGDGSGGTTGAGTPYVSPFGAGGTMAGGDFRANPNIQNYEQYGFGGEATFFRPEYNKLVASGSMMGYTPAATTQTTGTPTYTPLIG
jgi:hypothetical protein